MTTARNLASFGNIVGGLVGELKMWPTGTAPTGYLLCNGALVSRTTYAALFAVVGSTYGPGDGSTTFNLPNFKDRMPIGAGTTYSANNTGGSTDAIVPSHTHTANSGSTDLSGTFYAANRPSSAPTATFTFTGASSSSSLSGGGLTGDVQQLAFAGNHTHTVSVTTTGVSVTNANLPPYIGIHFIIRYL